MTLVVRTPLAWLGPGRITPDVQITCEGDTITEVGPVRPVPDEARVIAIDGFCMPAGADRHVHAELGDTVVMLRRGVTAVRDLAWPPDRIFPLAEASELPGFHGPLIRAVGPMLTAPGGYPTKATMGARGHGARGRRCRRGGRRGRGTGAARRHRDQGLAQRAGGTHARATPC